MRGRGAVVPLAAVLLLAAFVLVMVVRPGGQSMVTTIDDVSTCLAGLVAAGALGFRSRRCPPAARRSWRLFAVGVFCAAVGDLLWGYYELVQHQETPFPSAADGSYLLFPVFTGLGLLAFPRGGGSRQLSLRMVSDGVLVAGSLFALSWATALGAVAGAGGDSTFAFAVALAYPVTDVVLLAIAVLVMIRNAVRRQGALILIGAALLCMAIADSAFAYGSNTGSYETGNLLDSGFVASYLLFAVAAHRGGRAPVDTGDRLGQPLWAVTSPYLLCAGGVAVSVRPLLQQSDTVPLATAGILIATLFGRQLLTIMDNRRLLGVVAEREQRLHHQAFHDDLTGLANRALFIDRLVRALAAPSRDGEPLAVLFLDIDDFKVINDSLGHDVGDAVLVRVANRLRTAVGSRDTVARLGGDEFAILVEGPHPVEEIAARVATSFDRPLQVGEHTLPVRASLGLAPVIGSEPGPTSVPAAGELLKRADLAMYAAKRAGKGQLALFRPELADLTASEFGMRDELAHSIAEGSIQVAYQPIFDASSRALLGVEALARWTYHGKAVAPDVFLPVARRLGLIDALDRLVLDRALAQLSGWRRRPGCGALTCAVNTNEVLLRGDPVRLYLEALRRHGLPAGALVVELPESHLSDSVELTDTVARLRAAGIKVALDDFGTHGSSLSRLHRVRVDTVKLDRDFLRPGPTAPMDPDWLGGIVELAHSLGIRVVAEGVETLDQLTMLAALGCDAVQGYLLGAPVAADRVPLPAPSPASAGRNP